jgi:hypothetical protein
MIVKSEDLERALEEREPGKDLIVQGYDPFLRSLPPDCEKILRDNLWNLYH